MLKVLEVLEGTLPVDWEEQRGDDGDLADRKS